MVYKYLYGNPIPTEAVILDIPASTCDLVYFNSVSGDKMKFTYTMGEKDIVYGLGENVRGINKRGGIYESKCSDEVLHVEDKKSLYGAHNFLIVHGDNLFGIFVDDPGIVRFDIGCTNSDELVITSEAGNLILYIIEGQSVTEIVKRFRAMIGQSYIPPKWAFGYGQSRWSYMNKSEIMEIVSNYRKNNIPLDMVYLDIDYMDNFKDFTLNEQAFPNLKEFTDELRKQGIRLVPIIDAGVKIEEGYDIYEEGVRNDYFCKDAEGKNFVAAVWPGRVHFPDVLNKEARSWFGNKYKYLLNQGIEGFWNDMNEPSIFYSEDRLKEVFEEIDNLKRENIDIESFSHFQVIVKELTNNAGDYKRFYHNMDGRKLRHDEVHNLYGYNMTRAAAEAFEELEPDKRILLFSRSSYIGMHRFGGIWTGDNMSWWNHLLLNIKMMPSLNMCGLLFSGADIGGFAGDTTEDLLLRWLEFGIFTPLMRNHTAINTRRQEAYQFEKLDAFRNIIMIRYGMLPYIYSEFVKAAVNNEMYFKPLAFDYPEDAFAAQVEDQLLVGAGLMIAPVYQQNATGRYVYLPERMKMYRMKSLNDIKSEILDKGHHYVDVALDELIVFLRPNNLIPLSYGSQCVDTLNENKLFALAYVIDTASYLLYQDDGYCRDFRNPQHYSTITLKEDGTCSIEGNMELEICQII
jgi:alpha-glucosidase